jgi:hypothetical protein
MALSYNDFGLGRVPRTDSRSRKFALAGPRVLPPDIPKQVTFKRRWQGDQGKTSQCVGFSLTAMLRCTPYEHSHLAPTQVYVGAQKDDEWSGESYEGSSVLGGVRYLSKITDLEGNHTPEIASYHSLEDVNAMIIWMAAKKSSIVVGTDWDENMFDIDMRAFIKPGGRSVGGHAYHIYGYNLRRKAFLVQNSWGKRWGVRGLALMHIDHMAELLSRAGEAWGVDKINFRRVGHYPGKKGAEV